MAETQDVLVERLREQALACRVLGSDLYGFLLTRAAEDVEAGGPILALMGPLAEASEGTLIALKLMGAVHRLVLEGRAPQLAPFYPSTGGRGPIEDSWEPFCALIEAQAESVDGYLHRPIQTNEVGRSAAFVGGFLEVARRTGMPLRILEIGASAGLNLNWDRYRYEASGSAWGDASSPVVLTGFGSSPPFEQTATVVTRACCDPKPVDASTPEGRLTLSSFVWPDQEWRWRQMRGALEIAAQEPIDVEASLASRFLERELLELPKGIATVVYHSVVIQYMESAERDRAIKAIVEAGRRATEDSPLAWLRMEPPARHFKWAPDEWEHWGTFFPDPPVESPLNELALVHLNLWPGGATETVARAGYHGRPIHWF